MISCGEVKYFNPYCLKNKNSKIALRTVNFSFQVNQAKSVQGARLYIDIGVHLALNKFEYQGFVY
jgi:ABC-type transport system involved in cytochrome bd biosynthesis fused ATPase/permease subunit